MSSETRIDYSDDPRTEIHAMNTHTYIQVKIFQPWGHELSIMLTHEQAEGFYKTIRNTMEAALPLPQKASS